MPCFSKKNGFTLPLTIVILIVIGALATSFYNMVKSERIESYRRFTTIQNELELESGTNYAFFRMQKENKPWRTDSLCHTSQNGTIHFCISQKQDGAFAKISVFNHDSSQSFDAHSGFIPPNRPALTLLASQANTSLAGKARIEGGTALKIGSISYSTHYKMQAAKEAFHDTVYTGEFSPYFKTLKFYPDLSRNQFSNQFAKERCVFDGSETLNSTLNCKTVIMQGRSRCDRCRITADRIFIREKVQLTNASIIARTISLKDSVTSSGTFFARDSIEISLFPKQDLSNKFILQGFKTGDNTYTAFLNIQKLKAENSLVIFLADNWEDTFKNIPITIADSVDLRGALISGGTVDFRGKITGQMVAYNFGFYEGSTLWSGFLRDGQIIGDTTVHPFLPDIVYLGGEASYEK